MLVEDEHRTFRSVTIGDSSVGKTSLVNKFIHNRFNPHEKNTIVALYDCYTEDYNGEPIEVQVWDTAGQEQYRSLSPVHFKSAAAALLVFDLTNPTSFHNINEWLAFFRSTGPDKALLFLIGNKTDLEDARMVSREDAAQWATEHSCPYFETSAKTGDGVNELFRAVPATLARHQVTPAQQRLRIQRPEGGQKKEGCCH
jgi:small GTP-binding protein